MTGACCDQELHKDTCAQMHKLWIISAIRRAELSISLQANRCLKPADPSNVKRAVRHHSSLPTMQHYRCCRTQASATSTLWPHCHTKPTNLAPSTGLPTPC